MHVLKEWEEDEPYSWQDDVENTESEPWIRVNLSDIINKVFGEEASEFFIEDLYNATKNDEIFDGEYLVISLWRSYLGEHEWEDDNEVEVIQSFKNGLEKLQEKYDTQQLKKVYDMVMGEIEKQKNL